MNRGQKGKHVVLFIPERGKITANHYNRFLTSFELRGTKKMRQKGGKIALTTYTIRLRLNMIGLGGLNLKSRDRQKTDVLQSCLNETKNLIIDKHRIFFSPVKHLSS